MPLGRYAKALDKLPPQHTYSKVLDASAEVLLAVAGRLARAEYKPSCFSALSNQHSPNRREGCYSLSQF
ncbi:hypothetical protein NIES4074_43810 [Cylindrospermum sp. NIES-4074]|nr:hypothetical protein NIES4074_43810 [Cylindrospermum sp. NIES-4074]